MKDRYGRDIEKIRHYGEEGVPLSWSDVSHFITVGQGTLAEKIALLQEKIPTARIETRKDADPLFPIDSVVRIEKLSENQLHPSDALMRGQYPVGSQTAGKTYSPVQIGSRVRFDTISTGTITAIGHCEGQIFLETDDGLYRIELIETPKEHTAPHVPPSPVSQRTGFDAATLRESMDQEEKKPGLFSRLKRAVFGHREVINKKAEESPHKDFIEAVTQERSRMPRWRRALIGLGALTAVTGIGYTIYSGGGPKEREQPVAAATLEDTDEEAASRESASHDIVLPDGIHITESSQEAAPQQPVLESTPQEPQPIRPQEEVLPHTPFPPTAEAATPPEAAPDQSQTQGESVEGRLPTPPEMPPTLFTESYTVERGDNLTKIFTKLFSEKIPGFKDLTTVGQQEVVNAGLSHVSNRLTTEKRRRIMHTADINSIPLLDSKGTPTVLHLEELGPGFYFDLTRVLDRVRVPHK